jgi:hypothetical protein
MKISKSFKIYIHIFSIFFFAQQLLSETTYSKNIIVHKEPINIKELKFQDFNLNEVDLTGKKWKKRQHHDLKFLGYLVRSVQKRNAISREII